MIRPIFIKAEAPEENFMYRRGYESGFVDGFNKAEEDAYLEGYNDGIRELLYKLDSNGYRDAIVTALKNLREKKKERKAYEKGEFPPHPF